MDCDLVQVGISQRMDGAPLSDTVLRAIDAHAATCATCTAFSRRAERIRAVVRIHEAEPVPDLVGPIMAAVALEPRPAPSDVSAAPGERRRTPPPERRPERRENGFPNPPSRSPRPRTGPGRTQRRNLRPSSIAAAVIVGLVLGSVLVGGPWPHRGGRLPQPAQATDIGREVLQQATRLDDLQVRFSMVERNFAPDVPVRRFDMRVLLSAPERFRLGIRDHTTYPEGSTSQPNDLSYIVNRTSSYAAGPTACPPGLAATCPRRSTTVTNRPPFSSDSPIPSDLLLPLVTLGGVENLVGRPSLPILGRPTETLQLSYQRAAPLFPFLRLPVLDLGNGAWRPYFSHDRVALWLDKQTLLPLRIEIWATTDAAVRRERSLWEQRFGMLRDPTARPLLSVVATSLGPLPSAGQPFRIPKVGDRTGQEGGLGDEHINERARGLSLARAASQMRLPAEEIARVAGLAPYRAATAPAGDGSQTILAFARGVSWLKIGETRDRSEPALFGVDPHAEQVMIPGMGVGYFEPSSDWNGRRLAIHTAGDDLALETNLPRSDLLRVASVLGVRGRAIPASWRVQRAGGVVSRRVSLPDALRQVGFHVRLPADGDLPPGYIVASAELTSTGGRTGLSVFYRQVDTDLSGSPIQIHEERGDRLAPAVLPQTEHVRIDHETARFDPTLHRLQWIHRGVYFSIDSSGLELAELASIARSFRPPVAS
jgi:hypothetical protein